MLSSQRLEFLAADVTDVAAARVKCDYCRIVGLEYRGAIDDRADADVLLSLKQQQMEAIIVYCPEGGVETVFQSVQVDLDTGKIGTRQHLLTLSGFHNITHATLSSHGNNEEVILCYTEIIGGRTSYGGAGLASTPSSSFNGSTPISFEGPNERLFILGDDAKNTGRSPHNSAAPTFRLVLHAVGTNVSKDITSFSTQELSTQLKGYRSNNICQRAYFLRQSKQRSQLYILVSNDYVSLAVYQVGFKSSKGFEFNAIGQGLAGRHLWHHWCPLTQRISFWVYRNTYELRVMKISSSGTPTPLFQMADSKRGKVDQITFSPPPNPCLPWGSGNSSLNANFAITMLPIMYESSGERPMRDTAMCYQKLVNVLGRNGNTNTSSSLAHSIAHSGSHKVAFNISIYLLQNWLHNISLVFEVDVTNIPITACLRASFVFLEGLVAIIVPGVFVHFVDVAHHDQAPRYMFGIDLLAHRSSTSEKEIRADFYSTTAAGTSQPGSFSTSAKSFSPPPDTPTASFRQDQQSGSTVKEASVVVGATPPVSTISLSKTGGSGTVEGLTSSKAFSNASGYFNTTSNSVAAAAISFVASQFAEFSAQAIPLVPHRSGNWVLLSDSTKLVKVSLNKANLWRWIRDGTGGVERFGVHNAIHVATTHFDSLTACHGYHSPIHSSNANGDRLGIKTVADLLEDKHTSVTHSFLCQVLIGETYNEVRRVCRSKGNPYWHHVPMSDDHGLAELEEVKVNIRKVNAISDKPSRAWVRDICKRTNEDWWLQGDDVRRPFIFGLLSKKTATPMHRFSLTGGIVRAAHNHSYLESIRRILLELDVPKDSAELIANIYNKTLDSYVKALLDIEGKNISPYKKLHFLHNVKVALLALDFPAPDHFDKLYTELALQLMPPSAIYECVRGRLIAPSLRGLFKHYDVLQAKVNDAARDTGFTSQHLPINSIGYDPSIGKSPALGANVNAPSDKEYAAALGELEDLCPSLIGAQDYALNVTSSAAVASPGVTSDEKHALIATIQPEPVLQSYRRHFPLDTTFGKYLPLNHFVDAPLARESRLVAYSETELAVRRERAKLVMLEALYPMLQEPKNTSTGIKFQLR